MQARRHVYLATLIALLATQTAWAQNQGRQARQPVIRRVFKPQAAGTQLPASWTITGNQYVSQNEYNDLKKGCMELLRRYPPDKYYFVGMGRDPAPVIAFLQNLGEKNLAVNLPGTSNIGWANQVKVGDQVVATHIEAAIPEHILRGERQIVILDVSSTGKTPAKFGPYLDHYLQARGNHKPVIRLSFSPSDVKTGNTYGVLTDWISTTEFPDFDQYPWNKYQGSWTPQNGGQGIAEHQGHAMSAGAVPPTQTNPQYTQFRQAVLARQEQDPELDGFIQQLNPQAPALKPVRPPPPPKPWPPKLAFKPNGQRAAGSVAALFTLKNKIKVREKAEGEEADEEEEEPKEKPPESYSYLSKPEYDQLRDGALAIMKQAHPQKAFYVGVGRSSGPMVAFFENLGKDIATYLPADGLRKVAKGKGGAQATQDLDALFDAFIPAEALRGTRTIVLFQRSNTGSSLPFVQTALSNYLLRKGSSAQVQVLSLAEGNPGQGGFVNISQSSELQLLNDRKYFLVSPYDYFRPGKEKISEVLNEKGTPLPRSKAYATFKGSLMQRMSGDPGLAEALSSLSAE